MGYLPDPTYDDFGADDYDDYDPGAGGGPHQPHACRPERIIWRSPTSKGSRLAPCGTLRSAGSP